MDTPAAPRCRNSAIALSHVASIAMDLLYGQSWAYHVRIFEVTMCYLKPTRYRLKMKTVEIRCQFARFVLDRLRLSLHRRGQATNGLLIARHRLASCTVGMVFL